MQYAFEFIRSCELTRDRERQAPRSRRKEAIGGQLCLPGFKMQGRDNLFLALQPGRDAAEVVERRVVPEVRGAGGFSERSRGVDLFHVTLLNVSDCYAAQAHPVSIYDALGDFAYPSFDLALNTVMRFASANAIVLTGDDVGRVRDLGGALRRRLIDRGVRGMRPVCSTPHMTLLYSRRPFHEHKTQPVKWRVREFCLIHSLVGQSRHVVLERWPLLVNETVGA